MKDIIDIVTEVNDDIAEKQLEAGGCMSLFDFRTSGNESIVKMLGITIWGSEDGFEDIHSDDGEDFTKENLLRQAEATFNDLVRPMTQCFQKRQ